MRHLKRGAAPSVSEGYPEYMQPLVKKPRSSSAIKKREGAQDVSDIEIYSSYTDNLPVINASEPESFMQQCASLSITKNDADSQANFQGALVCRERHA